LDNVVQDTVAAEAAKAITPVVTSVAGKVAEGMAAALKRPEA
jgi:glycine cleavage system H lipoate-binding protein